MIEYIYLLHINIKLHFSCRVNKKILYFIMSDTRDTTGRNTSKAQWGSSASRDLRVYLLTNYSRNWIE